MSQTLFPNDVHVSGGLTAARFTPPAGSISNAGIAAGAGIEATKMIHQNAGIGGSLELFAPATSVAALTKTLGMAYAAGTLIEFGAWIEVDTTGADRTVTVDLQKSTGGGAYATVLSATADFADGAAIRTFEGATISSAAFVAGDIFRVVVTVAGAAGAAATGLSIRLLAREAAQ